MIKTCSKAETFEVKRKVLIFLLLLSEKKWNKFFSCAVKNAFADDDQSIKNYCRTIFMVSIIRFSFLHTLSFFLYCLSLSLLHTHTYTPHTHTLALTHVHKHTFSMSSLFLPFTLSPTLCHTNKYTSIHAVTHTHKHTHTRTHSHIHAHTPTLTHVHTLVLLVFSFSVSFQVFLFFLYISVLAL